MGTDDPRDLGFAEKSENLVSLLAEFLFFLPHSRSECTRARFLSVPLRAISGFLLFFVKQCIS